jgi:uncharacterized protein YutE (UPF0331/DUF86 family)
MVAAWIVAATMAATLAPPPGATNDEPKPLGGNERVLLVANGDSAFSLALANRYAQLRSIPAEHVLLLDDLPGEGIAGAAPIALDECRERILKPILAFLDQNGLADEIDAIVYSSGFPHAIDVAGATGDRKLDQYVTPVAALTGLTYFAREVARGDLSCLSFDANRYCKSPRGGGGTRDLTDDEKRLLGEAQAALKEKRIDAAAAALRAFTASYAENGDFWYDLACCEALLGQKEAALVDLRNSIDHGYWDADHAEHDDDLVSLRSDPAYRTLLERMRKSVPHPQESRGFHEDPRGHGRYYLSTILAWLGPYGTTFAEACAGLEKSAAADATEPKGTFYFLKNGDVRATTRASLFAAAVELLRQRGRAAEILEAGKEGEDGILPKNRRDVLGAVVGSADFDWSKCGSTIVPGAIVEHLTSFGATFQLAGQTKCTAFMKAGAAGSSGTVTEPYALQAKFPTPFIHVHYVDGCTLAESFYESVAGPYQLLVIGDACCRPFATPAQPTLDAPLGPWKGRVELAPGAQRASGSTGVAAVSSASSEVARYEAWIDGRPAGECAAGGKLVIESAALPDGIHDLRVVAVAAGPVAATASLSRPVTFDNHGHVVQMSGPKKPIPFGSPVGFQVDAAQASEVVVARGLVPLARTRGGSAHLEIPASALGLGRSTLVARARFADGSEATARAEVTLEPPPPIKTTTPAPPLFPAWWIDAESKGAPIRAGTTSPALLLPAEVAKRLAPDVRASVHGWLKTEGRGLSDWSFCGDVRRVVVDGKTLFEAVGHDEGARFRNVALAIGEGWHAVTIDEAGAAACGLSALGPDGPQLFDAERFGAETGAVRLARDQWKTAEAALGDGNRSEPAGAPAAVEVDFTTPTSLALVAIWLTPPPGAAEAPVVLEGRAGSGGWSKLKPSEQRLLFAPPPSPGAAAATGLLCAIKSASLKQLRITPAQSAPPNCRFCELEFWKAGKSR